MGITPHDAVIYGVSEACKFNDHTMCRGCGCDCHKRAKVARAAAQAAVDVVSAPPAAQPAMVCPKCNAQRPAGERFCRLDGSLLLSLTCGGCGKVFAIGDQFCWHCGRPVVASDTAMMETAELAAGHQSAQPSPDEQAKIEAAIAMEMEAAAASEAVEAERVAAVPGQQAPMDGKLRSPLPPGAIKLDFMKPKGA